jgi:predicted nucleic acid-binding protein
VRLYLDTSLLIGLFTTDALTARSEALLRSESYDLVISDFASAEFSSGIARLVRMEQLTRDEAWSIFSQIDRWGAIHTSRVECSPADINAAQGLLRRLEFDAESA